MKWLNREEGAYLTGVMSYTSVFFREGQWVGFTTSSNGDIWVRGGTSSEVKGMLETALRLLGDID